MHCHIAWHASQGLAMNFVERTSEIPAIVAADDLDQYNRVCKNWDAWEPTARFDMDDSGI
jgi:hypothetical protein